MFLDIFHITIFLFKRNNISVKKIVYKSIVNTILVGVFFFTSKRNRKKKKNRRNNNIKSKLIKETWKQGRKSLEITGATDDKKGQTRY